MIKEILLLHHSHYDRGYMHHPEVEDALQADYLRQIVEYCSRHPHAKWTAEVTRPVIYLLDECNRRGDRKTIQALAELADQGRFGVGALATHITPLADRQELKELVADSTRVRRELATPVRTAFQHDINGLPWPISDVLIDAGVELLITGINEAGYGRTVVGRHRRFHWRTPQGRSLLVYNGDHYGAFNREMHPEDGSLKAMLAGWKQYEERIIAEGHCDEFCYLTATLRQPCDCNPADEEVAELVAAWNREHTGPPIRFVTGEDLLEHLKAEGAREIATHSGDWTDWWNFGCATVPKHVALARRGRQLLRFAESLDAQSPPARIVSAPTRVTESLAIARENLGLWNEHTYGCYKTEGSWNSVESQISCEQKNSLATRGFIWAELAVRLEMERLSGNPPQSRGYQGCLISNPTPQLATFYPRVPREWLNPLQTHNQSWMHHTSPRLAYLTQEEMVDLAPVVLDGWEARQVPIVESHEDQTLEVGPGMIRNSFLEIRFDLSTGRILSVADRGNGQMLLPKESDYGFAEPVAETLPGRPPTPLPNGRIFPRNPLKTSSEFVAVERFGSTVWLVRRHRTPTGHGVLSRIGLGSLSAEIAVNWELTLADTTEANGLYAVFPTTLAEGWRAWFDTAGQRVEMDAEQLPLACRDYPTVETYAEMADTTQRIKLHTPDVPLVMFGDFHWGKHNGQELPRPANPLLLSFVYNNYWNTNFAITQPGTMSLGWVVEIGRKSGQPWSQSPLVHPVCRFPVDPGSTLCPQPV